MGLLGFGCLAASLLMGLWMEHVRERPVYERPPILIHPVFRKFWTPLKGGLFGLGWIILGRASPRLAVVLALILLGLWSWKRYLRSGHHRHQMIREAFERERARDPAASDAQILRRILHAFHGRWGEELIDQIVTDNPTPERVADLVVRMERGALPPSFNPSRMLRGGR